MPLFLLACSFSFSQTKNTKAYNEEKRHDPVSLKNISWISGHWKGEALGGIVEEIWSPPLGDSMMFSFKLVVNDKVKFYELGHIKEVDNTILLQLKHFDSNLHGWEAQGDTVDFKFIKAENNRVYFDGFTFEKINDSEMNVYVIFKNEEGKKEMLFNYKKQ